MALDKATTKEVLKKFGRHEGDTSSPEVQVALLTTRLQQLGSHFTTHVKDHHSRRGLLKLVGQRKRLLNYLSSSNPAMYQSLIQKLGIRK